METLLAVKDCGRIYPPKQFSVGSRTYLLEFSADPENTDGGKVWGFLDPIRQVLTLDPDMEPQYMAEILLHELLHGAYNDYWYSIRPKKPGEVEEFFVSVGSKGLTQIFRDNPRLFRWWLWLMVS